jgi:hypothetical protein
MRPDPKLSSSEVGPDHVPDDAVTESSEIDLQVSDVFGDPDTEIADRTAKEIRQNWEKYENFPAIQRGVADQFGLPVTARA